MSEYFDKDQDVKEVSELDASMESLDRFEPVDDILERCESISYKVARRLVPSRAIAA
jgi:hypothetical protein